MSFWSSLREVWRRPHFRRLFVLRVVSQGADATLQVGMASYVLFSPQAQPNAGAIAAILAITLLPFSVVGPFVGIVLDRVPRRTTAMAVDATRAVVALLVAGLVLSGLRGPLATGCFYAALLLAMSLSRFLLAGLAAALPFVVDDSDYLAANSVIPIVGPLGAVLAGLGMAARVLLTTVGGLPTTIGDAAIFCVAAALFLTSVTLASRFHRHALGPDRDAPRSTFRDAVGGLAAGLRELRAKPLAGHATLMIAAQRVVFGLVQVATILLYRNHFHTPATVNGALADIGIWAALTGIGFVAASFVAGPLLSRLGLRRGIVVMLLANALVQLLPGSIFSRGALWVGGFLLGVVGQGVKIGVDTVTQDVVDDAVKGRVFVIYDIVFNVAMVLAAALGVVLLPSDGASLPVFLAAAGCYVAIAVGFALASRRDLAHPSTRPDG